MHLYFIYNKRLFIQMIFFSHMERSVYTKMEIRRKQPIGVELVKRGIVKEGDIEAGAGYAAA